MRKHGPLVVALASLASMCSAEDAGLLLGVREKDGRLSTVWVTRRGVATIARKLQGAIWYWRAEGMWRFEESGDSVVMSSPGDEVNVLHSELPTKHNLIHLFEGTVGLREEKGNLYNFDMSQPQIRLSMSDLLTRARVGPLGLAGALSEEGHTWTMTRKEGEWWFGSWLNPSDPNSPIHFRFKSRIPSSSASQSELQWSEVIIVYPEAVDFATNSKTDIAVVVTKEGVFVHRTDGASLANCVHRTTMDVAEVLSVQWIGAKYLDKVQRALVRK